MKLAKVSVMAHFSNIVQKAKDQFVDIVFAPEHLLGHGHTLQSL